MTLEHWQHHLQSYLYENIPLSRAMQVQVTKLEPDSIRLAAPLAPNINHRQTVFGGSASALATLAAWSLLFVSLDRQSIANRIVIQHHRIDYLRPLDGEFHADCHMPQSHLWRKFMKTLQRYGKARIEMTAVIAKDREPACLFSGDFVSMISTMSK